MKQQENFTFSSSHPPWWTQREKSNLLFWMLGWKGEEKGELGPGLPPEARGIIHSRTGSLVLCPGLSLHEVDQVLSMAAA